MKHLYKIGIYVAVLVTLNSCAESGLLDYNVDKPESIAMQEEINSYDVLNKYVDYTANPNFNLGAGVDMSTYNQKGLMYRLINTNFNQITLNSGMQHSDIVQANGSLLFTNLNNFLDLAKESSLAVFGNSLVWNKSQNGTYLNGLLDPLTIAIKPYANLLNKSSFATNSLTGWGVNTSSGGSITVVDGMGLKGGKAIKLVSGTSSSAATDLQLTSPSITIIPGHEYEVIMYVKSNVVGEGRFSFNGLVENVPALDWTGSGKPSATFGTSFIWKQIKFKIKDFTSNTLKINLDFGYKPNVTYYIDTTTMYLRDVADSGDSGGGNNTLVTGDKLFFEAECGSIVSGGKFKIFTDDSKASEGKYLMVPQNPLAQDALTNTSLITPTDVVTYDFKVNSSGTFKLWARVGAKASTGTDDSFHFQIDNGAWYTFNARMTQLDLKWYDMTTAVLDPSISHKITVSWREDGGKLDKLYLTNAGDTPSEDNSLGIAGNCGGVVIVANKSTEEKTYIVNTELEKWISGVVGNSKEVVKAWNVVNEPMDDANPYQVKSGNGVASSTTQFFWQDYLGGKDYGIKAFKLAKANANPTDLLFISDYGLDENLDKCRGLIQYVQYLETNAAQVDGIAAKMHLTIYSDRDNIATMFELLATTGKKVAISDLYVKVLSSKPTADELQLQSDMYRYVIETYAQKIPTAQRYGISLSGLEDGESTDALGLWKYRLNVRKPAYSGFAEGLKSLK